MKKKVLLLLRRFTWLDWLLVVAFLASVVYLIFFSWTRLYERRVPVEYLAASDDVSIAGSESGRLIWIDVAGAVVKPGVYQLPQDARIKDALVVAGGLTSEADRTFVEKIINLAAKMKDGDKVYVPTKVSEVLGSQSNSSINQRVNINTATSEELDSLWGVGAARAADIAANRPYQTVEDLITKKVITKSVFEKIKDKITVY